MSEVSPSLLHLPLLDLHLTQLQSGLRIIEVVGIICFAMSGALLGVRKRFDLFGVVVLGSVTAVGGGAIRDTLTGQVPPLFLRDELFVRLAILGSLLAFAFGEQLARAEKTLTFFDSLGLAVFASSGALGAMALGTLGPFGVVFAGMLSGVGGGIVRDLIANEVPEVMYRRDELYATAAALGAAAVYISVPYTGVVTGQMIGIATVLLVRVISRQKWVRLPVRRLPGD